MFQASCDVPARLLIDWFRGLLVWLLIIAVESVHGTLRQVFLAPVLGDAEARRVAVFSGMALILLVTLLTIRWIAIREHRHLLRLGALWVVLTGAFEVALGRALGFSWQRIFEDYDLPHGTLHLNAEPVAFPPSTHFVRLAASRDKGERRATTRRTR